MKPIVRFVFSLSLFSSMAPQSSASMEELSPMVEDGNTEYTGAMIVLGMTATAAAVLAIPIYRYYFAERNFVRDPVLPGLMAAGAEVVTRPGEGGNFNNDLGRKDFASLEASSSTSVLNEHIHKTEAPLQKVENKTQNLRDRLTLFMKNEYQAMDASDKDKKRFCLRRARKLRQAWTESHLGAVYVIQQADARSNVYLSFQDAVSGESIDWTYHVAALYVIRDEQGRVSNDSLVLDPLFEEAITLSEWKRRLGVAKHKVIVAHQEDYDVGMTKGARGEYIPIKLMKRP